MAGGAVGCGQYQVHVWVDGNGNRSSVGRRNATRRLADVNAFRTQRRYRQLAKTNVSPNHNTKHRNQQHQKSFCHQLAT